MSAFLGYSETLLIQSIQRDFFKVLLTANLKTKTTAD
jgi:hypothetical protein